MLIFQLFTYIFTVALISKPAIVATVLIIVVTFFTILLCLGIRKSFKLQKENKRLEAMSPKMEDDKDKPYIDFTKGHMYD